MVEQKAFDRGMVAGFLFAVAAFSVNWLISPMNHPDASQFRQIGVIAQALVAFAIGLFLLLRRRPRRSSSSAAV
ncbi:MAG TPA: hypothetical protein VLJ83_03580 [Gemmatimonadaceae bacterium]|nr:hypothetical protein [Gemmatimonadaceae bacterium]